MVKKKKSARAVLKVHGFSYRSGSRLAAASEMITWAKAGMTVPPSTTSWVVYLNFFFQAEDGIRDRTVTGVQTCALPISSETSSLPFRTRETVAIDTPA